MVRNLMMIAGLTLAVSAFGCSDDDTTNGGGGGSGGSVCPNPTPSPVDPACNNPADLAELATCEPQIALATACVTPNIPPISEAECATNTTECLLDGNGGASAATTLSPECTACTAALACCITHQCSVVATPPGACVGQSGAGACDECIAEKCAPIYESCGEGAGGNGGNGGNGGSGGSGGSGGGGG